MITPTQAELALLADRDHQRLVEDVRRELTTAEVIDCPKCGDECCYEPPYDAEPDVGVTAWPGGFCCGCGWKKLDDPPLEPVDLL